MLGSICKEKVFNTIYNNYAKDVHDYLYYKYGNQLDINDIVQDAFIKLWDNCKKILPEKARAFLFKVAKNTMLNVFKHEKVILKYQATIPKNYTNESPEFILEEKQFYKKYQKALSKLTEEQRVVFTLNKIEGKKQQEIADMLNITKKVVEYRLYTAFNIIKTIIKELN